MLAFALFCRPAVAADEGVVLDGLIEHPSRLAAADLAALPSTEFDTTFETDQGPRTTHDKGVLLWTLIERAGLKIDPAQQA